MKLLRNCVPLTLCLGVSATAQVFLHADVGVAVPDADVGGLASTVHASGLSGPLQAIRVNLVLEGSGEDGGFNGDLYAYLRHDTGFAVLLNRPGRQSGNLSGYGDNGMSVSFSEIAAIEIHDYRVAVTGSATVGLDGPLTGDWRSDGRLVDPEATLDFAGQPRTATLNSFSGLDPNGEWTLHVFDLSPGGSVTLQSWSVEQMAPVPEPETVTWMVAMGLGAWVIGRGVLKRHPGWNRSWIQRG